MIITNQANNTPEFRKALDCLNEAGDDLAVLADRYRRSERPVSSAAVADLLASSLLLGQIVNDLVVGGFQGEGLTLVQAIRLNLDLDTPAEGAAEATEDVTAHAEAESPASGPREAPRRDEDDDKPWHSHTPDGTAYSLTSWEMSGHGGGGSSSVEIELTRSEYIHLKRCLAEHRGLVHDLGA